MIDFVFDKYKHKYFAEYFAFSPDNLEERNEALDYLKLWKKNLLHKLCRDSFHCEIVDEQWGERPPELSGILCHKSYLYLKLCLECKWEYELQ